MTAVKDPGLSDGSRRRAVARLDDVLADAVAGGVVPAVVGIVASRDGVLYEGAHGFKDIASGSPMTADTVCWMASCTKAITTVAAMQLVERGELVLDEPVDALLPELANPQVLVEMRDGEPVTRPAIRPITFAHLLTHTAGFTYSQWNGLMAEYKAELGIPSVIESKDAAITVPLVFDPGERWEYGISIDWVGKAIERATGTDLATYVREHILIPLGMRNTGYIMEERHRQNLATVYFRDAKNRLHPFPFGISQDPEFFMGGGGMFSTAADYMRLLRAILGGGSLDGVRILEEKTVELMAQNHIGDLDVTELRVPDTGPLAGGGGVDGYEGPTVGNYDAFPGIKHKWTLSFDTNLEAVPGGRSANSISWCGGLNTYYWIDPSSGITGITLAHMMPFPDSPTTEVAKAFERAAYEYVNSSTGAT